MPTKEIKEGNKAPDFTARDQNGKKVKLSSFKGKKNIVLYFYPKDMTPGCTTQACDFRDQQKKFKIPLFLVLVSIHRKDTKSLLRSMIFLSLC